MDTVAEVEPWLRSVKADTGLCRVLLQVIYGRFSLLVTSRR